MEANGINVIADAERKGKPADLFWPWFAANISVFGISYGAFALVTLATLATATVFERLGWVAGSARSWWR